MVLVWGAWKIMAFPTESQMGAAQDQGWWSFCLSPTWTWTVPGPSGLACAGVCDIMLRILEDNSNMYTPGSALKRTSLFAIY